MASWGQRRTVEEERQSAGATGSQQRKQDGQLGLQEASRGDSEEAKGPVVELTADLESSENDAADSAISISSEDAAEEEAEGLF